MPSLLPVPGHLQFTSNASANASAAVAAATRRGSTPLATARAQARGVGARPRRDTLKPALVFIERNLDGRLTLPNISAAISLSPCHFAHVFKRSLGVTPHQYVIRRRVERAKDLLASTHLPLADVALAVGCANQSHFCALFVRATGVTPLHFRSAR